MIIGLYSFNNARSALMTRTFYQLTTVRNVRKNQVESFFKDRIRDIDLISKSKDVFDMLNICNQLTDKITNEPQIRKQLSNIFHSKYNQYLNKYLKLKRIL